MKTTFDIPDTLLARLKSHAALAGTTMRGIVIEAMEEKLGEGGRDQGGRDQGGRGWRKVFGRAPAGAVREIQAVIDREFEIVDPDDWR